MYVNQVINIFSDWTDYLKVTAACNMFCVIEK